MGIVAQLSNDDPVTPYMVPTAATKCEMSREEE